MRRGAQRGYRTSFRATHARASPLTPDGDPNVAVAASTATGQAIVDFTMQFQGYAHVWAGNTPAVLHCSGFTQYVILNIVGVDIGHGTTGQMNYGARGDWGAKQPADLVHFAGTFGDVISHTGVSIGDGLFIHAENESTGVTISNLYSDCYAGHYYGAIHVG